MIVGGRVEYPAEASDVVHHDDRARRTELDRPLDVRHVVLLVRIDEDQVERFLTVGQRRQCVQRGADDHLHTAFDPGARQALPRHLGMLGFVLERDNAAAGTDAAGQLDGAVSRECADLEYTGARDIAVASMNKSFPCWADTSIAGIPAAAPASRAALSASSSVRNARLNSSSSAFGSGSATR